jgi:hypothetical protein
VKSNPFDVRFGIQRWTDLTRRCAVQRWLAISPDAGPDSSVNPVKEKLIASGCAGKHDFIRFSVHNEISNGASGGKSSKIFLFNLQFTFLSVVCSRCGRMKKITHL